MISVIDKEQFRLLIDLEASLQLFPSQTLNVVAVLTDVPTKLFKALANKLIENIIL